MILPLVLIDTGPLVALADKGQKEAHKKSVAAVKALSGSLIARRVDIAGLSNPFSFVMVL